MNVLITGNMGYVGPSVIAQLRATYPQADLVGIDQGYFAHCLTGVSRFPDVGLNRQIFADVRDVDPALLRGMDAVVQLAAISNDPMGETYAAVTEAINFRSSVHLAEMAKAAGVSHYVFASSCSVYGFAEGDARSEQDPLNPLTAYARSKIDTEKALGGLADDGFTVTCLRFATACGMSARLRLDLVLNDFVAGAVSAGEITILSDGTPWRPLIHVDDMARAIDWAVARDGQQGGAFLAINAGSDEWNYQVSQLADAVAAEVPGTRVSINPDAVPDKRSYRVSFAKYRELAPAHQPQVSLQEAVRGLRDGLTGMGFNDTAFRDSDLIRLRVLNRHRQSGRLDDDLHWRA